MKHTFEIVSVTSQDAIQLGPLVADFRVTLKVYKGLRSLPDWEAGTAEMQEYLDAGFPCYAAHASEGFAGYIVCRIDEPCVWVESIYVRPEYRRTGVASALFRKAEELAASHGEETVFNYVHPNNHGMIGFLRAHGYTVLNLIEIRKPYQGEKCSTSISIGEHAFDY